MSQSSATKLVSKLRYKIQDRRRLSNPEGPQGRHNKIRKTITALLKHERLELNFHLADESRGYAERLISDAIRHGDCHTPTMEMASYWITEKPVIHKLFKVLAPRYRNHEFSYTQLWRGPNVFPGHNKLKCVLELRNNIYPPLAPDTSHDKNLIHNVLLEEAKKEYRREKAKRESAAAAAKQSINTETTVKESGIKQTSAAVDSTVESDKVRMNSRQNELPKEENLKGCSSSSSSSSTSESLKKNEENTSDIDLDLNKMELKEQKQPESKGEVEKK